MLTFPIDKMPDKRIYVGIREVCDTTLQLSKGFRELGFDVTNVVMDRSYNDNRPYGREGYKYHDSYIRNPQNSNSFLYVSDLTKEFFKRIITHDVFIFNSATSFYGDFVFKRGLRKLSYFDLPIIKMLGNNVGIIANGSDIRSYNILFEELKKEGFDTHLRYIKKFVENSNHISESINKIRAKKIQKYADEVFVRPIHAQHLDHYSLFFPTIDPKDLEYSNNRRNKPLVIHAPTDTGYKGTKYVIEAIDKLRSEGYDFEFELTTNMANDEFRKKLTRSDIVIDQLLMPGHGLLAVEAMATGNAVLGSAVPGYNDHPEELPMITTTPESIYENVKLLVENNDKRSDLIEKGRTYVEENHHYMRLCKNILDGLEITY